jgi:hypothetical protein
MPQSTTGNLIAAQTLNRFTEAVTEMEERLRAYASKPEANQKYVVAQQAKLNALVEYFNASQEAMRLMERDQPVFVTQWHVDAAQMSGDMATLRAENRRLKRDLQQWETVAQAYGWDTDLLRYLSPAEFRELQRQGSIANARQTWPELY